MSVARTTLAHVTKGYIANSQTKLAEVIGLGPIIALAMQDNEAGKAAGIVSAYKRAADGTLGRAIASTTSTGVTDEATGYVGNATDLDFSGQALNNLPIVPKSIQLHSDNAGELLCHDGGDGHFYTSDTDEDECGTVDYFTGDVVLYFPAGKAPAAGAIDAAYLYEDDELNPYGRKAYTWTSLNPGESLVINGACKSTDVDSKRCGSTLVATDILVGGDATTVGGVG